MDNFNKLYNLILQSIISQNKASRAQMLAHILGHLQIEKYLNTLDNKVADFLAKYFANKQLIDIADDRIDKVISIFKRKNNINIQQKISLDQFLKQNEEYSNRANASKEGYLDSIPQLSDKKDLGKGVVIYRVQDNKKGMLAVRKIVDAQIGRDANPWCLISRHSGFLDQAWVMWQKYSAWKKYAAFKNGKIFAFCANDNPDVMLWWDLQDQKHEELIDNQGNRFKTDFIVYTEQQRVQAFIEQHNLVLNKETKRYDCDGDLYINNQIVLGQDGNLLIPLGRVEGDFTCRIQKLKYTNNLPTMIGGKYLIDNWHILPKEQEEYRKKIFYSKLVLNKKTNRYDSKYDVIVRKEDLIDGHLPVQFNQVKGRFSIGNCDDLVNLKGAPAIVGGNFEVFNCKDLLSLDGGPDWVGKDYNIASCNMLYSIKGIASHIGGGLTLNTLLSLEDLSPLSKIQYVHGVRIYTIRRAKKIGSLPKVIEGSVKVKDCDNLLTLRGLPDKVGKNLVLDSLDNLTSLEGCPMQVGEDFICTWCANIQTLNGSPDEVGDQLMIAGLRKLQNLQGAPLVVKGDVIIDSCNLIDRNQIKQYMRKIGAKE